MLKDPIHSPKGGAGHRGGELLWQHFFGVESGKGLGGKIGRPCGPGAQKYSKRSAPQPYALLYCNWCKR